MRTIIAGSRTIKKFSLVEHAIIDSGFDISEVVSGEARGVDTIGEAWAAKNAIPIKCFPADWQRFGKAAGPKRNEAMAAYADALIAVWDGKSRGTASMITLAKNYKLRIYQAISAPYDG